MANKKIVLLIIDGWGHGEKNISNPFRLAKIDFIDYIQKYYPFCLLNASGYSVGLPPETPASCEIGHFTIGTGTIYYQPFVKINLSIENGEFFENEILIKAFNHAKNYNSKLHLIGLISESESPSSFNHLLAIIRLAKKLNFSNLYLHIITDGVYSHPRSSLKLIKNLENIIKSESLPGKIATLCGSFYALDKTNQYFLKTQRVFFLLTKGTNYVKKNASSFIEEKYKDPNFTDDILEPTTLDENGLIKDNDAIIFFHHKGQEIYQLFKSLIDSNFKEFKRDEIKNLFITSLTRYSDEFDYPVAFEEQKIQKINLSRLISENNLKQIKIIDEKRKELLSYYFNGFIEEQHPGEFLKVLSLFIENKNLEDIENHTAEFLDYIKLVIKENIFDLIIASIPSLELISIKYNLNLVIKFLESFFSLITKFTNYCLENKYSLILTSDHGNIEKIIEVKTGQKDFRHNPNPVYFYLIDDNFRKEKNNKQIEFFNKKIIGGLVDITPTILALFKIPPHPDLMGKNILEYIIV